MEQQSAIEVFREAQVVTCMFVRRIEVDQIDDAQKDRLVVDEVLEIPRELRWILNYRTRESQTPF